MYRGCDVPPIRARLLATKDVGDQRAIMMTAMQRLADEKRMEFHNRVYFSDKTIKAVVKLQPNRGDAIPNFASAWKGLSILACRPKTTAEIEEEREWSAAERQTAATHMFPEALQLEKGDSCMPTGDYDQLKKNMLMFTLWNTILCGEWCDFANKLNELNQVLLIPSMGGMDHKFTALFC